VPRTKSLALAQLNAPRRSDPVNVRYVTGKQLVTKKTILVHTPLGQKQTQTMMSNATRFDKHALI
jgi:hypothetical protein